MREALARAVWYGEGFGALIARAALTPAEWVYGAMSMMAGATRARGAGLSAVPTVSVGNITVGGTGKTPMAAWVAAELRARGRAPAILLRGYGDDEPLVHAMLNPTVAVVANPNRRLGGAQAVAQGATALVLDDAFQHRQMPRDADIVLVSADLWQDVPVRLLPAGPFREPLVALRRASCVVVTRKSATPERAGQVVSQLRRAAGDVPLAVVHLAPQAMREWSSDGEEPLESLR
ncbi:MAG: tetraacyldisaccharide 4'-kinase, partial [Gemmatimonadetes bacterium]|nr:tetraacyldisaccharide 4'-kinase [Gemmatimonadota bacterium]